MNRWRVFLFWKYGMNLVTFHIFSAYSFEAAQRWVQQNIQFTFSKKRGVLYKAVGRKKRIYSRQDYEDWYEQERAGEEVKPNLFRGDYTQEEREVIKQIEQMNMWDD